MPTITVSFEVDDTTAQAVLSLLTRQAVQAAAIPGIVKPDPLERLLKADLNSTEEAVLLQLATSSPEYVSHTTLLALCGSPQKYGNVMSGLSRRWQSRGGTDVAPPWRDVGEGYVMDPAAAARVLDAYGLDEGEVSPARRSTSAPSDEWLQYEDRYRARPETFEAYVDVWQNVPGVQEAFGGWASFSQAANSEPSQRPERVRLAEEFMEQGGYEIGPETRYGGRTWRRRSG